MATVERHRAKSVQPRAGVWPAQPGLSMQARTYLGSSVPSQPIWRIIGAFGTPPWVAEGDQAAEVATYLRRLHRHLSARFKAGLVAGELGVWALSSWALATWLDAYGGALALVASTMVTTIYVAVFAWPAVVVFKRATARPVVPSVDAMGSQRARDVDRLWVLGRIDAASARGDITHGAAERFTRHSNEAKTYDDLYRVLDDVIAAPHPNAVEAEIDRAAHATTQGQLDDTALPGLAEELKAATTGAEVAAIRARYEAVPSDAEREAASRRLASAYAEGRITRAEFDDRDTLVRATQHRADLGAAVKDLPRA